jgi:S-adenosylmethionine:tRNA ribosyltransferase-isomerase
MLDLSEFEFVLPEDQIAKYPASPRDHSKLLVCDRKTGLTSHAQFFELTRFLRPGDILVLNNTKVLKARLSAKSAEGKEFEILLLSRSDKPRTWKCLVKPGKHIALDGTELRLPGEVSARVFRESKDEKQFEITFPDDSEPAFSRWLDAHGSMPLPPYLKRPAESADSLNYQTVYAEKGESVAAPTAGLHFTPQLLGRIRDMGVEFENIQLEIGYGTFSPLEPSAETLHSESYSISPMVWEKLLLAKRLGRRVIAVGTTTLRALESAAQGGVLSGSTSLFIRPGYSFKAIDGLITNFHLPQSSLFILVCAWMGTEGAKRAYAEAIKSQYRFFSYGDGMLIL